MRHVERPVQSGLGPRACYSTTWRSGVHPTPAINRGASLSSESGRHIGQANCGRNRWCPRPRGSSTKRAGRSVGTAVGSTAEKQPAVCGGAAHTKQSRDCVGEKAEALQFRADAWGTLLSRPAFGYRVQEGKRSPLGSTDSEVPPRKEVAGTLPDRSSWGWFRLICLGVGRCRTSNG